MRKGYLNDMVAEAKRAAQEAVRMTKVALGRTTDPDLDIYNRLTPADFEQMTTEHGIDKVSEYIQTMEAKRLKGG